MNGRKKRTPYRIATTGVYLLCASLIGACGKAAPPSAGLMLVISRDRTLPIGRLQIAISSKGSTLLSNDYRVPDEATLPTTVAIVSNGDPTQQAEISVTGWEVRSGKADLPLDRRDAIVTQIPNDRVAALTIVLSARCSDKLGVGADGSAVSTCDPGDTCDNLGNCSSSTVSAAALPTYQVADASGSGGEGGAIVANGGGGGEGGSSMTSGGAGPSGLLDTAGEAGAGPVDPCEGKVCDAPPKPECSGKDGNTLTTYAASGTCNQGTCKYVSTNELCELGCLNGGCIAKDVCKAGDTTCIDGALASCAKAANGSWVYAMPIACPSAHQTCTGAAGSGECSCAIDPVCPSAADACASSSTLASCAKDAKGCFYQASSVLCSNGACSAGACCSNVCENGKTACLTTSSTQIQSCSMGGNGCTKAVISNCDSGLVCERVSSAACLDPNWAQWQVPDYTYTSNGGGIVTDNVTALAWQQVISTTKLSHPDALTYCTGLTLGGYQSWRLPTMIELASLLTPGVYSPNIQSAYFPNTPSDWFWSATRTVGKPSSAYEVDFGLGNTFNDDTTALHYVRCVR